MRTEASKKSRYYDCLIITYLMVASLTELFPDSAVVDL